MHHSLRSRLAAPAIAMLFGALAAVPAAAQLQVLAHYPLLTDVLDATAQNGPITLGGTTPPAQPNNGVCVNGIYLFSAGGQDVRTPAMPTLDTTDFQFEVEFRITALPGVRAPVLMGGNGWRWLGLYVQANGTLGLKYNNSNFTWSSTTVSPGVWYAATVKFEAGVVQIYLNGGLIHEATVGVLNDGNNKNFTTNDFSTGSSFHGCIRNLVIANDTTLDAAMATRFGAGCVGVAGEPALTPVGAPQLGSVFLADLTNFAPSSAVAFLAVGLSSTGSPLGALPASMVPFGLAPGCDLLVSGEAMLLMFTTSGTGVFAFPVPASPAFTGQALYLQGASLDGTMPGGVALSNGLALSLGL